MNKTDAKAIARNILQETIGSAYYKLEDTNYKEEEKELITKFIEKEATRMLKLIERKYITY